MKKMKIVIIYHHLPPVVDGIGDYVYHLAFHLVEESARKAQVHVVSSNNLGIAARDANPFIHPIVNGWTWDKLANLARCVYHLQPDIVHLHYPLYGSGRRRCISPNLLPLYLRLRKGQRFCLVQTLHDPLYIMGWKGKLRHALNFTAIDAVIFVDEEFLSRLPWLHRQLIRWARHVEVIPVPSNIPSLVLDAGQSEAVRAHWGISDGELMLTFFGFINDSKGLDLLLPVLRVLPAKLIIICELHPKQDAYHQFILDAIRKERVEDKVITTGYLPAEEVASVLGASDACVFPFRLGVCAKNASFLAAVAQGTFTLTTSFQKRGYFPQENVYYAEPGNSEEILCALKEFAGRKITPRSDLFPTWRQVARKHLELYQKTF